MPVPVWAVGQVLSASDVNSWFVPLVGLATANETRTSTTTLAPSSYLTVPVAANANYAVEVLLFYKGASSPADLKYNFTIPASTTGWYQVSQYNIAAATWQGVTSAWTDTNTAGTTGTSTNWSAVFKGTIDTAGTSGNLTFQFAQNTSNGTATTLLAGSALVAQRIG